MKKNKKTEKIKKEKSKKRHRVHILDFVIILLLLAMLVGIYFRYNIFEMFGNMQTRNTAEISFSVKNIQETTTYFISKGDSVYFKNDGKTFGTIISSAENSNKELSASPATETFIINNVPQTVQYPAEKGRIDAKGRIECLGTFSSNGTFLLGGSKYLSAGQTYTVCTEKATFEITVTDIKKIS